MQQNASKVIQYPAPTGSYKVFVKGKNIWRAHNKARLQISVGNPKQDGDKLAALTEWAAARFDHVTFIVSDTLQRHNISAKTGLSLGTAHILAAAEGHEWIDRNRDAIEAIPHRTVLMWDDCVTHPDYEATRDELNNLYFHDEKVKQAIDAKAAEFCSRRHVADLRTSQSFLLEEVAAFAIMMREPAADIYAGTWMGDIFASIARLPTSERLHSFRNVNFTEVDFVRNKASQQHLRQFV